MPTRRRTVRRRNPYTNVPAIRTQLKRTMDELVLSLDEVSKDKDFGYPGGYLTKPEYLKLLKVYKLLFAAFATISKAQEVAEKLK